MYGFCLVVAIINACATNNSLWADEPDRRRADCLPARDLGLLYCKQQKGARHRRRESARQRELSMASPLAKSHTQAAVVATNQASSFVVDLAGGRTEVAPHLIGWLREDFSLRQPASVLLSSELQVCASLGKYEANPTFVGTKRRRAFGIREASRVCDHAE